MSPLIYDIFGIGATIENFIRGFFWGMIKVLMSMVSGMIDAMISGVLSFNVLSNEWVQDGFKAALVVMFVMLPTKMIYEVLFSILTDNEQTMDISKKILGCITGVMIAVSVPVVVPMANNIIVQSSKVMTTDVSQNESQLGDALLSSVFVGFGGMSEQGPYGADKLIKDYQKENFSITQRNDADSYVWDFSEFMVIVGMVIYVVLLFAITIQIATRIFLIALLYMMAPICCTSLTKYQEPQAFNIWKSTLLGQMAMNFSQIIGLAFLANIVGSISNIGTATFTGLPVTMAQLALFFGAFSLILTLPNFIQAMIGGYSSGVMEVANQIQSGMHMMRAGTIGLATAGIAATIGRRNSYTGFREGGIRGAIAGNKHNDGTRRGGIVGATAGQKDVNGNRQGGIRGAVMGDTVTRGQTSVTSGGLRGAVMGSVARTQHKDGSSSVAHQGGIRGVVMGRQMDSVATPKAESDNDQQLKTSTYQGGIRGAVMGTTQVSHQNDSKTKQRTGGIRGAGASAVRTRQYQRQGVRSSQAHASTKASHQRTQSGLSKQRQASSIQKEKNESTRSTIKNRGGKR